MLTLFICTKVKDPEAWKQQFGYAKAMGALATIMLLTAVIVICLGPEAKGVAFGKPATS